MKIKNLKKEEGFALLFSVLIASLLLAVGLSIFNITLKELSISNATRQSIIAFYAADSGREQALYNDLKAGIYTLDNTTRQCKASIGDCSGSDSVLDDGPIFSFEITKESGTVMIGTETVDAIKTTITSTGKNASFGDKIEREIRQNY